MAACKQIRGASIAEDSDDEKRNFKVEMRATRKMKSEKSKRGRGGRGWPYKRRRYVDRSSSVRSAQTTETKKPGLCFGCSLPGHC